ncbi:MAG: thioesterase family protein [Candidatus Hodarchaeota archaeon]
MKQNLDIGLTLIKNYSIKKKHAAQHVETLSTPAMIAFMEWTARQCVQPRLPEGDITVGTRIDIKHLSSVPIGENLKVIAQLIEINNRRLTFKVKAEWKNEVIGQGCHERFIVNKEKFLEKIKQKTGRTFFVSSCSS